ncbi:MAG: cytochrome c biogenesis protein CcsA [Bacteroidia bacterium]
MEQQIGIWATHLAFATALGASWAFFAVHSGAARWRQTASLLGILHTLSVLSIGGMLIFLLLSHRFDFDYVWRHSSKQLPSLYVLSALWEGQEGSFWLWLFWHVVIGWLVWKVDKKRRYFVLGLLGCFQALLASMLLGVELPAWVVPALGAGMLMYTMRSMPLRALHVLLTMTVAFLSFFPHWPLRLMGIGLALYGGLWGPMPARWMVVSVFFLLLPSLEKIGSSPFLYLWETQNVPLNFSALDGNGLNPLLQNPWMAFHPPTLFLGYALGFLPWAYMLASLWEKKVLYKPLFTSLLAGMIGLGMGILMGAYWAYETLNFGGYWNWDPVENASLVPWLLMAAALHAIILYRKEKTSFQTLYFTTVGVWGSILYSSFLTRSGILGEASVHSFTDLGLGGQLLSMISLWGALSLPAAKNLFSPNPSSSLLGKVLSYGIVVWIFMALEITLVTSLPVVNKIMGTSLAPPAALQQFYYEWNAPLTTALLILSSLGLLLYWRLSAHKMLFATMVLSLVLLGTLWWQGTKFVYDESYRQHLTGGWEALKGIWLLIQEDFLWVAAVASTVTAAAVLFKLRKKWLFSGGSLAHMGFALMIAGALASAGYEKVLTQKISLLSNHPQADNVVLPLETPTPIVGYWATYKGKKNVMTPISQLEKILDAPNAELWSFLDAQKQKYKIWIPKNLLSTLYFTTLQTETRLKSFIESNLAILPIESIENRSDYYVELESLTDSTKYLLKLSAEIHPQMGLIAHPDHLHFWDRDLYGHITSLPASDNPSVEMQEFTLAPHETLCVKNYCVRVHRIAQVENLAGYEAYDFVGRVWLQIWRQNHPASHQEVPILFTVKDKEWQTYPASLPSWGIQVELLQIRPQEDKLYFRAHFAQRIEEFITFKLIEKPFIGLLWGGALLMLVGIGVSCAKYISRT